MCIVRFAIQIFRCSFVLSLHTVTCQKKKQFIEKKDVAVDVLCILSLMRSCYYAHGSFSQLFVVVFFSLLFVLLFFHFIRSNLCLCVFHAFRVHVRQFRMYWCELSTLYRQYLVDVRRLHRISK